MSRTVRTVPGGAHLAVVMLVLGSAPYAEAAWLIEPSARLDASYEDNVRLASINEEDGIVGSVTAQARLRNVTEISSVSLLGGINYRSYSNVNDDNLDDRDSEFLIFAADRRTARAGFGLDGSYRRDDLLRRILLLEDPGAGSVDTPDEPIAPGDEGVPEDVNDGADVDAGASRQQIRRERFSISPSVGYALSARNSIELTYDYYGLNYDENDTTPLDGIQDSETNALTAEFNRALSERTSIGTAVRVAKFEPDQGLDTDIYEATLIYSRQLSERNNLSVTLGGRRTESDASKDTGGLLNARFDRRTPTGSVFASIERSLYPNSFGDIVETDRIALGIRQRITERWSWSLRGQAFSTDSTQNANSGRNRDFVTVRPEIRWSMTPAWSVGAYYGYEWVDRENDPNTASGNSVGVSLNYTPPRRI